MNFPPSLFKVCNCNFTHNEGAKSLVYIKNGIPELNNNITLCDSIFYHNQGASIYVINQKVYLKGKVLFQNNRAKIGTGIYIGDNSTAVFGRNSDVEFIQNSADCYGGAIYSNGNLLFTNDSTTVFSNNDADKGGAIYSNYSSTISFEGNSTTVFSNNSVSGFWAGRTISSFGGITTTFEGNYRSTTLFSYIDNSRGGAIYSDGSTVSFKDSSTTLFSNNSVSGFWGGGAIWSYDGSTLSFEDNSTTVFSNNNGHHEGAAIYSDGSTVSFKDTSIAVFSNNSASGFYGGGAICDWI